MIEINKHMYKSYYYLLCIVVCLLPQAFILPIEASYENHVLENLEVGILSIGLITMLYKVYIMKIKILKLFYLACGIFYLIMIARELSFGRVFYPIGVNANGEQIFINIHQLWYGAIVYPIIAILVMIALFLMIKTYKFAQADEWLCQVPRYSILMCISMLFLSQVVFEKNMIISLANYAQLLEECTEILAYCSLVAFTKDIIFKRR